jgi:carbon-monoxide dehydrogenase medium subunit
MKRFDYYQPRNLEEAFEIKGGIKGVSRYVAGGTDVIIRLKQGTVKADALVSLRSVKQLAGIEEKDGISIGALTSFREIERDDFIKRHCPALHRAVTVLANPQIRNVATIGGNLCNAAPSADCAPPLLVMEAGVVLEGPKGRRSVSLEDFFRGPGVTGLASDEVLTEIKIPRPAQGSRSSFLKMVRVSQDIAKVNVAALLVMEGDLCVKCRLAAGAVAPVPMRLKDCETLVEGKRIDASLLEHLSEVASREVKPITDVRSTEEYRRHLTGVLVRRAIREALGA